MILPCNQEQFEALNILFNRMMAIPPEDIRASLTKDLLKPIQDKLNRRVAAKLKSKKAWNLSVTALQAKSYYAFFEGRHLGTSWTYEQIIIDKHVKLIEKTYG